VGAGALRVALGVGCLVAALAGFAQSGFALRPLEVATALTHPVVNCALALLGHRLITGAPRPAVRRA
jgi:hypothetical protein